MIDVISRVAICAFVFGAPTDEAGVYAPITAAEAKANVLSWAEKHADMTGELREAIEAIWNFEDSHASVDARYDAVLQTFYLASADVREMVDLCLERPIWMLPDRFAALEKADQGAFYDNNLRFFYARYLAVGGAYDEALGLLEQIDPAELVDPAASLFYQAVCEHGLLLKENGLKTIERLLEHTQDVPDRYRSVARLMRADLEAVAEKSLAEVARQMKDVRRRLSLGHGGPRVQEVEERIVATLDELIEQLEQQQGGASSASAQGQGSPQGQQSQSPLEDSQIAGGQGPGEVDPKNLGKGSDWGGLPDKAETEAKNLINHQFPQHYRQAVEEYLKKLAERRAPQR